MTDETNDPAIEMVERVCPVCGTGKATFANRACVGAPCDCGIPFRTWLNIEDYGDQRADAGMVAAQLHITELEEERDRLKECLEYLWGIIDDIDTYGDMAKENDKLFRSLTERRQKDRWTTGITSDGYKLDLSKLGPGREPGNTSGESNTMAFNAGEDSR